MVQFEVPHVLEAGVEYEFIYNKESPRKSKFKICQKQSTKKTVKGS